MLNRAKELKGEMVRLRRTIHRHPELGFREVKTAALVAETLKSLGIRVERGVGKTGVVSCLGEGPPSIGLRADMDALPIEELNEVSYASEVAGVMHACGHDAHVAMLLGVAMLLSKEDLPGQVRFLFQPSEEGPDEEGKSGAVRLVEEGAMEGVEAIIALHVDAETDTGLIKVSPGAVAAAVDTFKATIRGKGGHGAYPHWGLDPIFISGQVISAIHGIVSRHIDPMKPAVISIGLIRGGTAHNVIPSEVNLEGTIRSFEEEVREKLHTELTKALEVAKALGGEYSLIIERGCPALVNDKKMSRFIRQVGINLLGKRCVLPMEPEMGAEDFAILAREAPGAMFGLGVRKGEMRPAHNPYFDIDEEALPLGAAILAESAVRYLASAATSPS